MSAPAIKTPLTYGDSLEMAAQMGWAGLKGEHIASVLRDVDQASRDQQRAECAGHVSPHDLYEFLVRILDYLDDRVDVRDGADGQPVANEAMSLHMEGEALLARVKSALDAEAEEVGQ